ncbi:MAG: hypothetical protein WCJ60_01720 [bacterium]
MAQSSSTKKFYKDKANKKRTRVHVTKDFFSDVKLMSNLLDTTSMTSADLARIFNCGIATISRIKKAKDYADYLVIVQIDSKWATNKPKIETVSMNLLPIGNNFDTVIKLTDTEIEKPANQEIYVALLNINTTLEKLVNAWTETPKKTGWLK